MNDKWRQKMSVIICVASVLLAAVGAHVLHPAHHNDRSATCIEACAADIQHNANLAALSSHVGEPEHECPICVFLKVFNAPYQPPATAAYSTIAPPVKGDTSSEDFVFQIIYSAVSPRAPPA